MIMPCLAHIVGPRPRTPTTAGTCFAGDDTLRQQCLTCGVTRLADLPRLPPGRRGIVDVISKIRVGAPHLSRKLRI